MDLKELIESRKLNNIGPSGLPENLFECILHGKNGNKKALLPCFYKLECKTKISSCGHFYFIG